MSMRELQTLLYQKGWLKKASDVDGILGPVTTQAIKEFQAAAGLDINGVPDAITVARLKSAPKLPGAPGDLPVHSPGVPGLPAIPPTIGGLDTKVLALVGGAFLFVLIAFGRRGRR